MSLGRISIKRIDNNRLEIMNALHYPVKDIHCTTGLASSVAGVDQNATNPNLKIPSTMVIMYVNDLSLSTTDPQNCNDSFSNSFRELKLQSLTDG